MKTYAEKAREAVDEIAEAMTVIQRDGLKSTMLDNKLLERRAIMFEVWKSLSTQEFVVRTVILVFLNMRGLGYNEIRYQEVKKLVAEGKLGSEPHTTTAVAKLISKFTNELIGEIQRKPLTDFITTFEDAFVEGKGSSLAARTANRARSKLLTNLNKVRTGTRPADTLNSAYKLVFVEYENALQNKSPTVIAAFKTLTKGVFHIDLPPSYTFTTFDDLKKAIRQGKAKRARSAAPGSKAANRPEKDPHAAFHKLPMLMTKGKFGEKAENQMATASAALFTRLHDIIKEKHLAGSTPVNKVIAYLVYNHATLVRSEFMDWWIKANKPPDVEERLDKLQEFSDGLATRLENNLRKLPFVTMDIIKRLKPHARIHSTTDVSHHKSQFVNNTYPFGQAGGYTANLIEHYEKELQNRGARQMAAVEEKKARDLTRKKYRDNRENERDLARGEEYFNRPDATDEERKAYEEYKKASQKERRQLKKPLHDAQRKKRREENDATWLKYIQLKGQEEFKRELNALAVAMSKEFTPSQLQEIAKREQRQQNEESNKQDNREKRQQKVRAKQAAHKAKVEKQTRLWNKYYNLTKSDEYVNAKTAEEKREVVVTHIPADYEGEVEAYMKLMSELGKKYRRFSDVKKHHNVHKAWEEYIKHKDSSDFKSKTPKEQRADIMKTFPKGVWEVLLDYDKRGASPTSKAV